MQSRKIALNAMISTGARVINLALSLIIIGFVTRYLGQAGFGNYATILAFLYFFTVLSDLGLYSICVRDISRPEADESKIASNAFTIRVILGLLIFGLSPLIVNFFPYPVEVKLGVVIGAVGFWFLSNNAILISVFQKYLRMDRVAISEVSGRLVQFILVITFIRFNLGFLYIVLALVAGGFADLLLNFLFVQKYIRVSFSFDFPLWTKILKQSIPLGVASIITMIYFKLDTVMLSVIKSSVDVGIYSLAYKILESLIFFPAMLVGLIMPLLSRYAFSARKKFVEICQRTINTLLIFIVPLLIGTICLSKKIVIFIGGSDFTKSAGVLNILIIATGIIFLEVLFSNIIISLEQEKKLVYIYATGLLINLITNFIFIPQYSYYGAAATTLLTELVVAVLMLLVLYKLLKVVFSFKSVFKNILAGIIMALVLCLLSGWNLFLLIIIAVGVYFGILYLIGGFTAKDILFLIKKEA